jgi:hypothetical protein
MFASIGVPTTPMNFVANWTSDFGNLRNFVQFLSFTITSAKKHRLECFFVEDISFNKDSSQGLSILVQIGLSLLNIPTYAQFCTYRVSK